MLFGLQVVVGWMAFVALFGFALLGWAIYSGQLDDLEDTKYIPFNEHEPARWPGRTRCEGGVVVPDNVLQHRPAALLGDRGNRSCSSGPRWRSRSSTARRSADAGEAGHRPADSEEDTERVSPDGFIDSFAGVISEAGGGMPVIGWVIIGTVARVLRRVPVRPLERGDRRCHTSTRSRSRCRARR